MKKIITFIFCLTTILANSQSKKFVQYISDESYAFIDSTSFYSQTMRDYTRPDYINLFGTKIKDYCFIRDLIKEIVNKKGFSRLKGNSKDVVGIYCAAPMDTLIGNYMSTGMTQNDATMKYLNDRIIDVQNAANCYCKRINNVQLQVNVLLFLGEVQASTFNDAVRNFKSDLCSIALLGTQYGDSRDGFMDYIESTGSYTSGGLKSYTMSSDMEATYGSQDSARLALVQILHNLIINGE